MFKQNHIFLYIKWQKGFIDLKLIQNDLNECKHITREHQIKLYFMGVSYGHNDISVNHGCCNQKALIIREIISEVIM